MSDISNTGTSQQVYRIHGGDTLITQVTRVIVTLFPKGISVAGFSERGDLLMANYTDYKPSLSGWILDFFEHQFLNNELLAAPHKVIATFIAGEKTMLVPEVLYNQTESEKWMRTLHFIEGNEIINAHLLREDKAYYLFSWPAAMKSLAGRYFTKAKILPFSLYQFYKPFKSECSLQCSITNDEVYATLYKDRALHWHQVFNYSNAEDIAYHLKHLARENKIADNDLALQCTISNRNLNGIVTELTQYFPTLKDGSSNVETNDRSWTGTAYLLQQLYACAL